MHRILTGIVCLLMLTACAISPRQTAQPFPSSLPDELFLNEFGGPIVGSEIYSTEYRLMHDGVLTRTTERFVHYAPHKTTLHRRVTAQAWENFRQKVVPLHLLRWKANYDPRETIMDGYAWKLRIVSGDRRVESRGSNAAPDPENPSKTIEVLSQKETAYAVLSAAMDDLWGHSLSE